MTMYRGLQTALVLVLMAQGFWTLADEGQKFEIGGSARIRMEDRNNSDFSDALGDYQNFVGSRFRIDMKFAPNDSTTVFFQPQFSKVWGDNEYVATSTGTSTLGSSGALNDTGLDVHQAYVSFKADDSASLLIGRKELSYGDELLVGPVGWNNLGRSFDIGLVTYKYGLGSVDVFSAKLKETNSAGAGLGDQNITGLYSTNKISDHLQAIDAYAFFLTDSSVTPNTATSAYGVRAKSPIGAFDYRAELTFESVKAANSTDENQMDFEFGYAISSEHSTRVSVEYFSASRNFNQLFPTGHKWLGYADLFSRRNIQGYRAGVSSHIWEKLSGSLDYHFFQREDISSPGYKFAGGAYGAVGTDKNIAAEFDLVLKYKLNDKTSIEGGAALVTPGDYLKANGGNDRASFYYLQVSTGF